MRAWMCFVECVHFGTPYMCVCAVDYTSGALLANVEEDVTSGFVHIYKPDFSVHSFIIIIVIIIIIIMCQLLR